MSRLNDLIAELEKGKDGNSNIIIVPEDFIYIDRLLEWSKQRSEYEILAAMELARIAHEGQLRRSGEPYFEHLVRANEVMSGNNPGAQAQINLWLHDIIEDTHVTKNLIRILFGDKSARDAGIMAKNKPEGSLEYNTQRHYQRAYFEPDIALPSTAERVDNMVSIEFLPPERQIAKAEETFNIVVPIAYHHGYERLGEILEYLSREVLRISPGVRPPRYMDLKYVS